MNRSLKLSMLIALALGTSQAMAVDLGQVQVKSALGQPLLAEIPLHAGSPTELQNLRVQLASSEEFARAGIVGGRTSIPLNFSVANAGGSHPVIRITSSAPVDDPFLDLLIEVNGNAGKSVREYAILLDPPGAQSKATMAAAPAPAPVRTAPQPKPVAAAPVAAAPVAAQPRPAAAAPAPAPASASPSDGQIGVVERGQTLSGIARNVLPSGVDVQQMMLAIKQANPNAFYRDNINALKSGVVLRMPTTTETQAMTIAAAIAEVRRQNSDWRANVPGTPSVVADAAARASASSTSSSAAQAGDRLALVPAKQGSGAGNQGSGDKSDASLRQDLLRSKESLASLQQQSSDLKARLKDLGDINSKNERLLSLKDNEIAELQTKLAAARKSAGMPAAVVPAAAASANKVAAAPTPAVVEPTEKTVLEAASASTVEAPVTASALASTSSVASTPASAATTVTTPLAESAAVKPVEPPAAQPVPASAATAAAPASPQQQPWYMQTWAWAAGAGAVVLLVLLAMLGRRRKPAGAAAKSASSLSDRFGSAPDPAEPGLLDDDTDQEDLLDQLAEQPDDIYLHLELVTLYYSRRDVEHFEAAAEAMHAHITDPQQDEWQDVVHMGEDLAPEHPLFDHHAEPDVDDGADPHGKFDIDDYADAEVGADDAPTVISSMPPLPDSGPKKVSEYNFNFDLTHPAAEPPVQPDASSDDLTVIAPRAPAEPASTWNFDEPAGTQEVADDGQSLGEFSDDPVDTKLDLARAYVDMGDSEGARAMLSEVISEGTQMQRDTAKRLLESLH